MKLEKTKKMKIEFKGETIIATSTNSKNKYLFLVLGDGICPYGAIKDIQITRYVRDFVKEHYKRELENIKNWQLKQEMKFFLNY